MKVKNRWRSSWLRFCVELSKSEAICYTLSGYHVTNADCTHFITSGWNEQQIDMDCFRTSKEMLKMFQIKWCSAVQKFHRRRALWGSASIKTSINLSRPVCICVWRNICWFERCRLGGGLPRNASYQRFNTEESRAARCAASRRLMDASDYPCTERERENKGEVVTDRRRGQWIGETCKKSENRKGRFCQNISGERRKSKVTSMLKKTKQKNRRRRRKKRQSKGHAGEEIATYEGRGHIKPRPDALR